MHVMGVLCKLRSVDEGCAGGVRCVLLCVVVCCLFFFFFKQKTAYEISACLVGSEMCNKRQRAVHARVVLTQPEARGSAEETQMIPLETI